MSPRITALLAIPALAMAAALPGTESILIVGGEPAKLGEFPYIVSLAIDGTHDCGGVLVNSNTVVSAAHCVIKSASHYTARAGSLTWASGGVNVGVSSLVSHPQYSSSNYDNDIAIFKLAEPIEESDAIRYANLPSEGNDPEAGSITTVSGWGLLKEGSSSLSPTLQKVSVPVVSRQQCQSSYGVSSVTDNMFCAGLAAGGKDSCSSDSGGPIIDQSSGTLIGVVSWGTGCAQAGFPGVYTRIGNYIPFINSHAA